MRVVAEQFERMELHDSKILQRQCPILEACLAARAKLLAH